MRLRELNWTLAATVGIALAALLGAVIWWLALPPAQVLSVVGAAFATSTGANWVLGGRRWPIVALDLMGKSAGLLAGCYAAQVPLWQDMTLAPPGMVVLAAVVGTLNLAHKGLWWLGVQSFIFYGIGSYLGDRIGNPWQTAGAILLAAGYMAACLELPHLLRRLRGEGPRPTHDPARDIAAVSRPQALRLGLTAAMAVGLSWWVAGAVGVTHGYWAPLGAIFALRPDYVTTRQMVIRRGIFTILGALTATLLVALLPPGHFSVPLLFLVAAMAAAMLNGQEFRYFIAAITAALVLMISMATGSVEANAADRIWATIIGCVVTVTVAYGVRLILGLLRAPAGDTKRDADRDAEKPDNGGPEEATRTG